MAFVTLFSASLVKRTHALILATLLLAPAFSWAQELLVWQPRPGSPQIIVPVLEGESGHEAVDKYFTAMFDDADMRRLFSYHRNINRQAGTFTPLSELPRDERPRVLVQANMADDLNPTGYRMLSLLRVLSAQNGAGFVLPPAAALRLNRRQQGMFNDKLYDAFELRMNIGGDDIHPAHYGEDVTHSVRDDLNHTRDKFELDLILHWQRRNDMALQKGLKGKPEFGICRGHQIMAVASGHSMYQDVIRDGVSRDGTHLDRLGNLQNRSVQHWHHIIVKESYFGELIGRTGKVLVNDWHHQSVRIQPGARTHSVAIAPDGVVEALESSDRLTVSVQFHPEFEVSMSRNAEFTNMAHSFIGGIIESARPKTVERSTSVVRKTVNACSKLLF